MIRRVAPVAFYACCALAGIGLAIVWLSRKASP